MNGRNNRGVRFGSTNDGSDQQQQVNENQSDEGQSMMGLIMERNIVERKVTGAPFAAAAGDRPKKRQSHFSQQQQMAGKGIMPAAASPSLNMPLGAFVKKRNNTVGSQPKLNSNPDSSDRLKKKAATTGEATTPSDDADAMLAQMSASERLEMAEELRAALTPEAVAFLKKRRANAGVAAPKTDKNAAQVAPGTSTQSSEQKQQPTADKNHMSEMVRKSNESQPEKQEKQRMAQILSNVKTYEDLDAAYKAEMGDFSPLSSELGNEVVKESQKDPFQLACILLRSTVPRQNLWAAKAVSNRLQNQWETGDLCSVIPSTGAGDNNKSPDWPYPVLLPASLRCLLDSSLLHTGYVLHTYVLQAMYNLLRLRSCIEHITDVDTAANGSTVHAMAIYQECFLEDSVPTPPIGSTYQSTSSVVEAIAPGNDASTTAAYKTSSSSKSAKSDGEAFGNDPSWTLLSRMCIIPRLAQLLAPAVVQVMPKEALSAICGILAIIGQRSPGAATAIVHHSTMLHDLLELTLKPRDRATVDNTVESPYECFVALPAMRLLCALARQSRVVAEKIYIFFVDIVPTILAMKPRSKQEHQLQKWSLILWRTLLRYGLGLAQLPTMITSSAPHMVVRQASIVDEFSLSNEFSSSFANVLFCLRMARIQAATKAQNGDDVGDMVMSTDQMDSVLAADHWLSSSAQQAVASFEPLSSASSFEGRGTPEQLQLWAGQLQFLSAFLETSREEARLSIPSTDASTAVETWIGSCQHILSCFVEEGFLKKAISDLRSVAYIFSFDELPGLGKADAGSTCLVEEASACAFLCAFVSLQLCLLKLVLGSTSDTSDEEEASAKARESIKFVVSEFASLLQTSISRMTKNNSNPILSSATSIAPTARRGWLNRACFASIQVLIAAREYQMLPSAEYNGLLRRLQFSLLGRLERGDEAMAAVLFSQDSSFEVDGPQEAAGQDDGSFTGISSVFLRELCRSSSARLQLEHSFNLRHGPGLASEEFGSSKLRSLLSDVDASVPSRDMDPLLPMGPLWLWLMLSGTIEEEQSEGITVLSSALGLILELEQSATSDGDNCFSYASQVSSGAKMYHLLTICLHSENIMQNEEVVAPAELLLDLYSRNMGVSDSFSLEFARACVLHSSTKKKKTEKDSDAKMSPKEQKLAAVLLNGPDTEHRGALSEEEIRAMLEFLGELCETYLEYGAQYDLFTKCVRYFLRPAFPSRIRCQAMKRLGDVLSLISLPGEDECQSELVTTLQQSIAGSLPYYDGSTRESPEFLDALVAVYAKGGNPRIHFGYILLLFVLVHARHLAICLQPGWVGLEAELKRLQTVHGDVASIVVDAANRFLQCPDQSKAMLVQAALDATVAREGQSTS